MGSSSHLWFCGCETATLGPELHVPAGPRHHLWLFHAKQRLLDQVSMGPRHDLSFCACTTVCLASEILVSMGPRPHLWTLIAKQRLLVQNYKSLWVPDLTCRCVH